MLLFTVDQLSLRQGLLLGERRIEIPTLPKGDGWAGILLTVGGRARKLDKGLVGELRWTGTPFELDADTVSVEYEEAPLPKVDGARAKFGLLRSYELAAAQGRPPLVFVELVLGASPDFVCDTPEQPAHYRASSFVALGGHGFSLVAPGPFDRYLAELDGGDAMHRFTTTDDGELLLAAGHFVPVWGVHQWDYRLVFCRGTLPKEDRPLLGREVLRPRRYPLDLGADGRLDVLTCVPQLQNVRLGLDRCELTLWPGKFRVAISGHTTGGYGVGLIPTYLFELHPYDGAAPDEILNGQSLPNLFEQTA